MQTPEDSFANTKLKLSKTRQFCSLSALDITVQSLCDCISKNIKKSAPKQKGHLCFCFVVGDYDDFAQAFPQQMPREYKTITGSNSTFKIFRFIKEVLTLNIELCMIKVTELLKEAGFVCALISDHDQTYFLVEVQWQ